MNLIKQLPFFQDIINAGGTIHHVGGGVRDIFLKKTSKDLDIIVSKIPIDDLEQILLRHGSVDFVGKSFGIFKFKKDEFSEEIDISLPRSEKKIGEGHKGFEIQIDHNMSIETDLFRRDFRLNSMAIDHEGNLVDPFNGMDDIKNKVIRLTNPEAFSDDPLRMLRAVGFASRFEFQIEKETMNSIKENCHKITEIPQERIYEEFKKIVEKGDKFIALNLLIATGLFNHLFDNEFKGNREDVYFADTVPEFFFCITRGLFELPHIAYGNRIANDVDQVKEVKAFDMASKFTGDKLFGRLLMFDMYKLSKNSVTSQILPEELLFISSEMIELEYPFTFKDLKINGDDLIELGFKGKQIGDILNKILVHIYADTLVNIKEKLIEYAETKIRNQKDS